MDGHSEPTSNPDLEPDSVKGPVTAFCFLGLTGLCCGCMALPTALFVGPHLVAGAVGHLVFAAGSLLTVWGMLRRTRWSWWTAFVLADVLISVMLCMAVALWIEGGAGMELAYPVVMAIMGIALIAGLFRRQTRQWFRTMTSV